MKNFKDWVLSESIIIANTIKGFPLVVDGNHKVIEYADANKLKDFINEILIKYYAKDYKNISQRYDILLNNIREGYSEIIFELELKPIGFKYPELANVNDDLYDFYKKHRDGKTGYFVHKTPKDAIKEIPSDPNLVYRGMSWEEWQFIRKKGFIQSNGHYNFDNQSSLTFYGSAETAEYYANGFAPIAFKTSLRKPSVVIAISKNNVKTNKDLPDKIPESEFAHIGPLNSKEITSAWMLSPIKSKNGKLEIIFSYVHSREENNFKLGNPKEGSRSNPSIGYAVRKIL